MRTRSSNEKQKKPSVRNRGRKRKSEASIEEDEKLHGSDVEDSKRLSQSNQRAKSRNSSKHSQKQKVEERKGSSQDGEAANVEGWGEEVLKERVMECAWFQHSPVSWEDLLREYKRFMHLKALNKDVGGDEKMKFSPGDLIDRVWHLHLLDTWSYMRFCRSLPGGMFLHHDPMGASDQQREDRKLRRECTMIAYASRYDGEAPPCEIWGDMTDEHRSNRTMKNRDGNAPERISITVRSHDGNEVIFKVKQTTPFSRIFEAYCQKVGEEKPSVRFLFDGDRISGIQTPADYDMRDGDEINATVQRSGC
eukprot:jgi/Bigna1/90329/estExt_fgenesh1_pg.C_670078